MSAFFKSKPGLICAIGFLLLMGLVGRHVGSSRAARRGVSTPSPVVNAPTGGSGSKASPAVMASRSDAATPGTAVPPATTTAAYLDLYYQLGHRQREEQDRHGNSLTRRENASTPQTIGPPTASDDAPAAVLAVSRATSRLGGHPRTAAAAENVAVALKPEAAGGAANKRNPALSSVAPAAPTEATPVQRPLRFNPYGSVLKCELVFTIDSTNEQTPLIGLVMEPVYNNGELVIPAGTELHGVARPDRLRDRIFSGPEWVLVFPREHDRPNGRQLTVKGVALDRVEPDANGMTWGITDGSYGLEGKVIRTTDDAEIKRFVATFMAASTVALQEKQPTGRDRDTFRNTPQNAVLQGLAANFEQIANDITAEIAAHGVFIRVPAGHQFYFYPMQIINADAADIPSGVATAE